MAGRVHPDYRRTGTKDVLYESGRQRMVTSSPLECVIFDALRSKYWEGKLAELENILKLERKWVRRPILIIKECELVKTQIFIQIKEWLFVLT